MRGICCARWYVIFLLLAGVTSSTRAQLPRNEAEDRVSIPQRIGERPPLPVDPLPREPVPLPPISASRDASGLPLLANAAGIIFSGTVVGISPASSQDKVPQVIAVRFHVENAIRGSQQGQDLQIQQWIGAWNAGQRYRVGERVLVFFYPASNLGLTSAVAGALGRFAVDESGRVVLSPQHQEFFRADPALAGKSLVRLRDFAGAVRRASGKE